MITFSFMQEQYLEGISGRVVSENPMYVWSHLPTQDTCFLRSAIHFVHTKEPKRTRISMGCTLNRNISSRLQCLWMVLIGVFSSRCDQERIVITMSWTTLGSGFCFREKSNRFSPSLSPDWLWNSHIPLQIGYLGLWAVRGERRSVYRVLVGNLRERDHLKDLDVNGKIILK